MTAAEKGAYESWDDVPEGAVIRNRFGDLLLKDAGQMIELVENGPLNAYEWGPWRLVEKPDPGATS